MKDTRPCLLVDGFATAALVGALVLGGPAGAVEFHFVVQEIGEKRAVWVPQEVVIHRGADMQGGLIFVLENPTDRTHAFAAYGLFEVSGAGDELERKPLRVNVTTEDTVRVRVDTAQFERRTDEAIEEFPFFCPLHKGEAHAGGIIRVVP